MVAYRTRQHMEIDIATIEKGSDYLGMVASIPPEDQFTRWRSEYEADILVSLASLAGERMFFDGDSSSGVSGDLESATAVASFMEGFWGMGSTVSSYSTAKRLEVGSPGGGRGGAAEEGPGPRGRMRRHALADRIEDNLATLLDAGRAAPQGEPARGAGPGARAGDAQDADRRGRRRGHRAHARARWSTAGRTPTRASWTRSTTTTWRRPARTASTAGCAEHAGAGSAAAPPPRSRRGRA